MCGILAALGLKGDPEQLRRMMLRQSKLIRHRGPDATAIWQSAQSAADTVSFLSFERLQIIDPSDGGKCATPPARIGAAPAPCCRPAWPAVLSTGPLPKRALYCFLAVCSVTYCWCQAHHAYEMSSDEAAAPN